MSQKRNHSGNQRVILDENKNIKQQDAWAAFKTRSNTKQAETILSL